MLWNSELEDFQMPKSAMRLYMFRPRRNEEPQYFERDDFQSRNMPWRSSIREAGLSLVAWFTRLLHYRDIQLALVLRIYCTTKFGMASRTCSQPQNADMARSEWPLASLSTILPPHVSVTKCCEIRVAPGLTFDNTASTCFSQMALLSRLSEPALKRQVALPKNIFS
jgi:hypothetical protein